MTAAYGYQGQLAVDTNATPASGTRIDFQSENLVLDEHFIDTNGLRGTRERDIARMRVGNRRVHGQLHLQPTAVEMALLLPWILGTAASGNVYALAETVPARYVMIDRVTKVFTYTSCYVDKCTIRGRQGEPLDMTLDVVGFDESVGNSGTFPSLTLDTTTGPFIFTDGVFVANSVTVQAPEIELVIDNRLDKERFFNSTTATALIAMDRHITLNTKLPYGDASAVYNTGIGGVTTTLTFTNAGCSVLFSMVKVVFPRKSPFVAGRSEIMLPMQGEAYKSSATLSLVTTLDSIP